MVSPALLNHKAVQLAETTKFAKLKRVRPGKKGSVIYGDLLTRRAQVLARRYNRNPFHIGVSLDGLRLRDQTCLAEVRLMRSFSLA